MLLSTLLPFQADGLEMIERFGGRCILGDSMGLGKAQPMNSLVLTPQGWVEMGCIVIGEPIIGRDGKTHHVTGVFPQGVKQVYKVTFRDGSCARCCGSHLWAVSSPSDRMHDKPSRVKTTEELIDDLTITNGNAKWSIPMIAPVEFIAQDVPLDPYLVGFLIANGGLTTNTPRVTIPDRETLDRIVELLPQGVALKQHNAIDFSISKTNGVARNGTNPLTEILRSLDLMGKGFSEKRVPSAYLLNTSEIRLALLRGLMDGDGSVYDGGGTVEYSTGSRILAKQVRGLIQSIGGVARIKAKDTYYTYKGERRRGATSYRINISLPGHVNPFLLSRKAKAYKPRTKYQPSRAIIKIEEDGKEECQCISVSAPDSLYITNDFIVTHNTVQYLAYVDRHPELRPAVIVTEASLKENTRRECMKHIGLKANVASGTNAPIAGTYNEPVTVINYDILRDWLPTLKALKPRLLIFDEAQALRTPTTIRSKAARKLSQGVDKIIFASGTPIENRPFEFWSTLSMLDEAEWGSAHQFGHRYGGARRNPFSGKWEFKGATNTQELHERLRAKCLIRRRKEDVLKDLPPVTRSVVPIKLGTKERKEYREAELDVVKWLKKNYSPEAAERAVRTEAMQRVNVLKQLAAHLKVPGVIDWQRTFLESGEKLMMFGWHTRVVEELAASVRGSVVVHGSVPVNRRQERFDSFNEDPRCVLFSGNMQAAGKGWSCTSCSNVAFCEFAWSPGMHAQCIDRCQGLYRGQVGIPTSAYFLVASETIDTKVCKAVQAKSRNVDMVLDGEVTESGFDVFDLVCDMLVKGGD